MTEALPIVLVPGLLISPRLYAEQLPTLWQHGPVTIADPTRDDTMAAIAGRILAHAPPRFALAGLSMGGYICFELARQAPDRVVRLALLDTSARPDTPELTRRRYAQIALARSGRFAEVLTSSSPCSSTPPATATRPSGSWCDKWPRRPGPRRLSASSRRSSAGSTRGPGSAPSAARRWCWSATVTS
jgi:pimeloyl-ACP methyl ester carboxylesterase